MKYVNNKSQILIIFLWILVVLVIMSVSLGQQASYTFRYVRRLSDKIRAEYLAKAAVNRAISEINKDTNAFDAVNEPWADNRAEFASIRLSNSQTDFASVSYVLPKTDPPEVKFGARDEERKINLNTAPEQTIAAILQKAGIGNAQEIAENILIWRGSEPDVNHIYDDLGYPPKAEKFSNVEELVLVKGMSQEAYDALNEKLTTYTDGLININTVNEETLFLVCAGIASRLNIAEGFAQSITDKLVQTRTAANGYFQQLSDINIGVSGSEEMNIFNELKNAIKTRSDIFFIEVNGQAGKIGCKVEAVYSRQTKKILFWHEV